MRKICILLFATNLLHSSAQAVTFEQGAATVMVAGAVIAISGAVAGIIQVAVGMATYQGCRKDDLEVCCEARADNGTIVASNCTERPPGCRNGANYCLNHSDPNETPYEEKDGVHSKPAMYASIATLGLGFVMTFGSAAFVKRQRVMPNPEH